MINVYLPTTKTEKSRIRGFWRGQDQVYYDYLDIVAVKKQDIFELQKKYKQEAIFYTFQKSAFIYYTPKKIEKLRKVTYFYYSKKRGLKDFIKNLLKEYGGFTVYLRSQQYIFEIWR